MGKSARDDHERFQIDLLKNDKHERPVDFDGPFCIKSILVPAIEGEGRLMRGGIHKIASSLNLIT